MENDQQQQQASFTPYPPPSNFSSIPPSEDGPLKHSKLGVASFIISMVAVLLLVIAIILTFVFVSQIANNQDLINEFENLIDPNNPSFMNSDVLDSDALEGAFLTIIGAVALIFGAIGTAFIGLILGIIGISSKNRRKLYGIIGVIINGLIVLGSVGFFVISLVIGASAGV